MAVKSYEELDVWKLVMELVEKIYQLTEYFPKKEQYRLVDQLCRAAISVPSNIAEGSMRNTTKDYIRFLAIAQGSIAEMETQLNLAKRLRYADVISLEQTTFLTRRVGKMLNGMAFSLQQKIRAENTSHQSPVTSHL